MKKFYTLYIALMATIAMSAQTTSNVVVEQVGKKVVVTYDLDKQADISLCYSTDGGQTYSQPLQQVSGDVGRQVSAGQGKRITWDVLAERDKLVGSGIVFKVVPGGGKLTFTVNGVTFTMICVEGGTFTMGATSEQGSDADSDEKPTHSVTLSNYYIGQTEVTQGLWRAVMGSNPSYFNKGGTYPMENVSWEDCQTFISKLNSLLSSQLAGRHFALPTEAQWEYAARGGKKSGGYKYSGSNTLSEVGWYADNSNKTTHPVAQKKANELGIYDMSGNVWEWCWDWYGGYSSIVQTNPTGASSGSRRVSRGGSWSGNAWGCRVSFRNFITPSFRIIDLGLRLVLSP